MPITETNSQYYAGAQGFRGNNALTAFTTTFDTDLVLGSVTSWNPLDANYGLNNFKLYTSTTGTPGSWSEYITTYTVLNNTITFPAAPANNLFIVVQLKILTGGKYGNTEADKAYGDAVDENYGSYQYVKLNDIIDNYMVGYVGDGKIIQNAKKSDVLFFAKRSLQEFSYDTLKSIKSQELTVPESLSLVIPQDYVNYVALSWIDDYGIKRPLYPNNNLTINPYSNLLQDNTGIPTQDNFGENLEGDSQTVTRWKDTNPNRILNGQALNLVDDWAYGFYANDFGSGPWNWGRLYLSLIHI